ncbi:MAG: alkaline phosphatase family protein [Candidatus Cybelea sp.]
MVRLKRFGLGVVAASLALSGCSGGTSSPFSALAPVGNNHAATGTSPIQHVVLIIQENRTFNNFFATFPGAIGSTTGYELVKNGSTYMKKQITLTESKLEMKDSGNLTHTFPAFLTAYQNGAMDGFNMVKGLGGEPEGPDAYQYVNPSYVQPYWTIASQWGLADEMFQTQGSESFTGHQDLIRGGTAINNKESLVDSPTSGQVWGCDSPVGTKTSLITTKGQYLRGKGPFPCSNVFPSYGGNGYITLRDLLDARNVPWKYYTPAFIPKAPNALWNAFDVIAPVRYGPEWTDGHIASPETSIFTDISNGALPAMSWVVPDAQNSDHPGYAAKDTGPSWVATIVNAIGQSSYWNSTVVIVVWDDWGGFYDPVAPPMPRDHQGGPGFRVPMLVVSPYMQIGTRSQGGYISNTVYGFGSILRFVEDTFNLGRLGTSDVTSTSMADMLNFLQPARTFQVIPTKYKRPYFLHQKPSNHPVDTN